jgi:hypothetical protein
MNTALEYSTRVAQEGGCRCKKSTLNDLVHLTPLRIPLMNPPIVYRARLELGFSREYALGSYSSSIELAIHRKLKVRLLSKHLSFFSSR